METQKLADLSTAHISLRDSELLKRWTNENSGPLIAYRKGEYGWFIYMPSDVKDALKSMAELGSTQEFVELVKNLCAQGVAVLCLDRDGEVEQNIPKFDW